MKNVTVAGGMQWVPFHHPDISLPIIGRLLVDEVTDLLVDYAEIALTRGRTLFEPSMFASTTTRSSAMSRLRKRGLIVTRTGGDGPELSLAPGALAGRPAAMNPLKLWDMKWSGVWYQIIYDVPESERRFRHALRKFLLRMRMGQLQESVYITPRDIRPDYDDLVKGAGLGDFAYLFETRTVLGQSARALAGSAWDFDALAEPQLHYLKVYEENVALVRDGGFSRAELLALAREELRAYLQVMHNDPLLPRALYPAYYQGFGVYDLHVRFAEAVCREGRG